MFRNALFGLFAFVLFASSLAAQAPNLDPAVKTGTLPNGVRYFLMTNPKPENRVELRLVVRAGSLQETDKEQGLAHLLEHLQFEGTDRFGPQEIVNFLETNGMKFGADLNAQTGFSSTQYYLDLPADKPDVLAKGLQVLEDWAHGPKVQPDLLEKEKKIIAEEQRVRLENVGGRLSDFYMPLLTEGAPYALRLPIGKMDVLAKVTPADVRHFVDQWYTPAALSVIIVGSFDLAKMESQLRASFTSTFANVKNPLPPPAPAIPAYTNASVSYFQDAEMGANVILWNKIDKVPVKDARAAKTYELANFLVGYTLGRRFQELTQSEDPPFLGADVSVSPFVSDSWFRQFQVVLRDGQHERSLSTYLTELKRTAVNGLTPGDLQLARSEYLSQVEQQFADRDNTRNSARADALAEYAETGNPLVSDQASYDLGKELGQNITLEAVNSLLGDWLNTAAAKALVLTIAKPGAEVPSEATLAAVAAQVKASEVQQKAERVVKPLVAQTPKPGKITKTEAVAGTPLTRWTLSNGLQVLVYKNQLTKNEVIIRGLSRGGLAPVAEKDYLSAMLAPYLFSNTGLGDLNLSELQDTLSGKQVSVNVAFDDTSASLNGSSVTADLDSLLPMVALKLGAPRRDAGAEASFLQQLAESLKNNQDIPEQLYQDELHRLLSGGNFRSKPLRAERMTEIVPDKAAVLYKQLLAGAPGFVLTITGDFDEAMLKPLVETWLASLPAVKAPGALDTKVRPAAGPVNSVLEKGIDNKAVVTLTLPVAIPYSAAQSFTASALREVLTIRMREVLRQDKEGTYGASVDVSLSPFPYAHGTTTINFTCDRARQDELLAAALAELKALSKGTISDDVFSKAVEIRKRALETNQKTNSWWANAVSSSAYLGNDLKLLPGLTDFYTALKKDAVVALAKAMLNPDKALTVILNPAQP
ncbi:MAG: insulinase family protein [Spirochaetales bacterium]